MQRRAVILSLALALAPAAALAAGGGEKKKGGGASYIQIPTLTATVFRPDGRRGVLTVETGVDVPDEKLRARAEGLLPRLRASYAQSLQVYAAGLPPSAPPNADYLGRQLQQQTDAVLGKPGARLLLGTILIN